MKLQSFYFRSQQLALRKWIMWLLIGSCLLAIGDNPRRQLLVHAGQLANVSTTVIQVGRNVVKGIIDAWNVFEETEIDPFFKPKDDQILELMKQTAAHIAAIEGEIFATAAKTVRTVRNELPIKTELDEKLRELLVLMNEIVLQENTMLSYLESENKMDQFTLKGFAKSTVAPDSNSNQQKILTKIDLIVSGARNIDLKDSPGILVNLWNACEDFKSIMCICGISAQQILHHLYNAIVITELKSYSMTQYSWMLLKVYGVGNFTEEPKMMHRQFEERTNRILNLVRWLMSGASRAYWRCDLDDKEQMMEDTNFLQFTRLLQGYVVNEVDLNTHNTCKEDCGYYSWGVMQEQCYDTDHCPKQTRCSGLIYDCQYLSNEMGACLPHSKSVRRYDYIEYSNGQMLGQKKSCHTTPVQSWWRWFYHCSYCFCICDDAGPRSDRFINLRESVSDVRNNMVVTGLRFVKKNRVIHLIVQQSLLLPRGQIANATHEWVEPEENNVLSRKYVDGKDYKTLNRKMRTMDLDDIILKPPYVLTGVRFRMLGGHINLEARMTEMDFATGKLIHVDQSVWTGNDKTEFHRTELKLHQPNVPLLSEKKSVPKSTSNQFIRFRESDRKKDAAQTTVPFFDGQKVVPHKLTPLGGCGVFHKGRDGYGGYVAPKVFTYDFAPHIKPPHQ